MLILSLSVLLMSAVHEDLSSFLQRAELESEEVKAIDILIRSSEAEIRSRDLEMVTSLAAEVRQVWDDRRSLSGSSRTTVRDGSLRLTKDLPTGTRLSILGTYDLTKASVTPKNQSHGFDWAGEIRQSLWRDAFGSATRQRQRADRFEFLSRQAQLLFERDRIMYGFELLFWDFILVNREIKAMESNLLRSRQSQKWIESRLKRSAAEQTDVLQARALVARRELELQDAKDRRETFILQLTQSLPSALEWLREWNPSSEKIEERRNLENMVSGKSGGEPIRGDAMASVFLAKALSEQAARVANNARPDLSAFAGAGSNAYDSQFSTALGNSFDHRFAEVGVTFALDLNFFRKKDLIDSARLSSDAQVLKANRLLKESAFDWSDLHKNIGRIQKRLDTAINLATLQKKKAEEERRRYEQGRSTAFQAISFEQEATEAELFAYRLQIQLRKEEARARFFRWQAEGDLN